jgi:two-component system phosphate regulon response regulator PhoB
MGGSILVVDDEAAIRDLLAANLQRAGYKVMTAGDVPQAEALVRDTRPDLVLIDWVLPGIPGLTFARRLRADNRTKDVSIVLLTARAEEQDKVTALESGCDDYVTKPFSARELLARIKARRRRGRDRRPAHRPGGAPGERRRQVDRPVDHRAAPAAFLHDAPGPGFFQGEIAG